MLKSSLVGHIVELLDEIRKLNQPADNLAQEFFRKRHYLGSKDRRVISEAVFDILRNYRLLQTYLVAASDRLAMQFASPQISSLAYYAAYAVKLLREDPHDFLAHLGARWRATIADIDPEQFLASLNSCDLPDAVTYNPAQNIAVRHSYPDFIVAEWVERFGADEAEALCRSLNAPAPTAIRVNLLKTTVEQCAAGLADEGIPSRRTSSSPAGLVLNKRINASASPTFRQGGFEFQDEGSQLLSLLPDPQSGETIVDACAGGGGKTLHLAMLMKNTGKLFAIDVDERRLNSIRIRLERAGVTICDLLLAGRDRERIAALQGQADAVLVDAPCSGVGTLRRNPGAKLTVNEVFIERMARTQRDVLTSYASLVKPGGRLVYSTCTLLRQENEEVVERFLGLHPEFSLLSATGALRRHDVVVESATEYLLLLPHRTSTDGFFAAVMQRGA